VLARKDDAGSLADSERIMLGDCAVVGVVDATLKLAAVLNDSEATPPPSSPLPAAPLVVPATTGSRLSGRRSSKQEPPPESDDGDGDGVVLPRTDVWLTFASHDRAVEWGTTLGATIEEWKKKNEKNAKKKGGIKGFMRRATSAFALKKSGSRDGKRGKGKPVQVPDSWRPILEASGVTEEHLSDPESLSSILAAVDEWSAAAATKKKAVPSLPSVPVARPSSSPSPAATSSESPRSMSPRALPTKPAPRPTDSAQDRATKLALLSASAPGILDSPTLTARVEVTSSPQESPRQHAHSVGGSVASSDVSMTPPSDDESHAPPRLVAAHARQQYVQIPVNPAVTAASVEAPDDLEWPDIPSMNDFPAAASGTFDEISLNETLKRAVLSIEINKKQHQHQPADASRQSQQQMYMHQQQQQHQQHQQQQHQQQHMPPQNNHPSASTGAQLINVVRQSERNVRALMNQMLCVLGSNPPNEFVTVQRLLELVGGAMETFVGATRQYGQSINDAVIGGRATELSNDTTVRFRALAGAVGQNNVAMSTALREQILQRLYGVQHAAFALRDFICDEPLGSRFPFVCAFAGCTRAYELAPDMVLHCRKRHAGMALQRPSQAAAAAAAAANAPPDGAAAHGRNASGTVLLGNAVGSQAGFGPQPVRRPSVPQQQTPYSHFGHAASSPQLRR
jgi:hypothetical protein